MKVKVHITLDRDLWEWLKRHPHVNLSGFVNEHLRKYVEKYEDEVEMTFAPSPNPPGHGNKKPSQMWGLR